MEFDDDKLYYVKTSKNAVSPARAYPDSAGLDLYAGEDIMIKKGETGIIPTNIQIRLPKNTYGRISDRSGLALKFSLHILGSVIDPDYTGS